MLLTDDEFEELQNMEFSQNDWLWLYTQAVENKLLEKLKTQKPVAWLHKFEKQNGDQETDASVSYAVAKAFCDFGDPVPLYTRPLPPDDVVQKYEELLYAVQRKFPDETRHQTALRYIKTAESPSYTNAAMGVK